MDTEEKPISEENDHPEEKPEASGGGDSEGATKNGDTETAVEEDAKDKPAPMEEDRPAGLPDKKEEAEEEAEEVEKEEEEEEEGGEEEDTEEDEDKEPPVPLLERPPQTSGRRERKTVERYVQQTREESKRGAHVLEEGSGQKLGDCPVICHNIATGRPDDVRVLHQIIFARPGRPYEFRKNLRAFRGFTYKEGTPGFVKKKENLEKYRLDVLRSLSKILDLDKKSGSREELALNILQFLCDPKPSGREVKQKKKKRKSKGAAGSAKKPKKATKSADAAEDSDSEDEDEDEDGDEDEDKEDGGEDGEEAKATPKKKKATPKKTPAKKTPKEKTPGKGSAKKTPAAKKTPKKRKKSEVDAAGSSSEDDEPLVKKSKAKKPPSDNDIRALVRKLLDGANLHELTMKNILTKVYAKYPDHDLTERKDFIKTTVKSLIS